MNLIKEYYLIFIFFELILFVTLNGHWVIRKFDNRRIILIFDYTPKSPYNRTTGHNYCKL